MQLKSSIEALQKAMAMFMEAGEVNKKRGRWLMVLPTFLVLSFRNAADVHRI